MESAIPQSVLIAPNRPRFSAYDIILSLVLHSCLLLLLVLFASMPQRYVAPSEEAVTVQIISSLPSVSLKIPPPPISDEFLSTTPTIEPDKSQHVPEIDADVLTQADNLLGASMLALPMNAETVAKLGTLAPSERIEQICNLEGMEQVAAANQNFAPEMVVAYAMGDTQTIGNVLKADGAALQSRGKWYNFRYSCEVSGEPPEIVSFAFKIGEAIPEQEWAEHYLVSGHDLDGH